MSELKMLKEAIKEKAFGEEPLALALLSYLGKTGVIDSQEVIKLFDQRIEIVLKNMVAAQKENNTESVSPLFKAFSDSSEL